jgi:hypothetical protein
MNIIQRMSHMITLMNLSSLLLYPFVSENIKDIMRANTFIIFIMVMTFWISRKIFIAYDEFVESLNITSENLMKRYLICFIIDIVTHTLPFMILGFPKELISLVISCIIISIWYINYHTKFGKIYVPVVEENIDYTMIATYLIVLCYGIFK